MVEFTFAEYTDMIFLYGETRGNGRAAPHLYQDRFPQRPTPSHTLFAVITQRLRERGYLHRQQERLWYSKETPHSRIGRGRRYNVCNEVAGHHIELDM